jgi:hypothetical protein
VAPHCSLRIVGYAWLAWTSGWRYGLSRNSTVPMFFLFSGALLVILDPGDEKDTGDEDGPTR